MKHDTSVVNNIEAAIVVLEWKLAAAPSMHHGLQQSKPNAQHNVDPDTIHISPRRAEPPALVLRLSGPLPF